MDDAASRPGHLEGPPRSTPARRPPPGADAAPSPTDGRERQDLVRDGFVGALLGTFVGDALGMPVEGLTTGAVRYRHGVVREMLDARRGRGTYTDDTEMTIAVAESLVARRLFDGAHMAARFVAGLDRTRGYGKGTLEALDRVAAGVPWRRAGAGIYGTGSFGNGAAMRVAPIGLVYHRDLARAMEVARLQSDITHAHPLGRAGAAVMAGAVALALRWGTETSAPPDGATFLRPIAEGLLDNERLFEECMDKVLHVLSDRPALPAEAREEDVFKAASHTAAVLGNDPRAFHSVPAALYCFLAHPLCPEQAVVAAVSLGGDTDTIAAMTGALCGAYRGASAWPARWLDALEGGPRGRDYVAGLADDLFLTWLETYSGAPVHPAVVTG